MRKIVRPLILILVLAVIGYFIFTVYLTPNERFKAINVIPKKSALIVEVDDPSNTWKKVKRSKVWNNFTSNQLFHDLNKELNSADSLLNNNKILFKLFGSRYVMVSIHERAKDKYESLIVADLERYSKLSAAKKYILSLANESISITKREYQEFEIYEIYQKNDHKTLYLTIHKNLAVLSYDQHLLEESLDCILNPILGRNDQFVQIHNQIFGDGLLRIYLNYEQIAGIINKPGMNVNSEVLDFLNSVYFSGFKMDAVENQFSIEGFTNIKDDQVSYLNALSKSGAGGFNAQKLIPKSARFTVRIGFNSFDKFMIQFEELLKAEGLYEDYLKNYNRVEKKLDIDIQENFIDWIDDEISLFSIEPRHKNLDDEFFIAIKAKNKRYAKTNLDFIKEQLQKKTPAKFTTIEYKGYDINYLQITGLIKLLFGNAFLRMEKPYYTIIEDFVLFSNHPQSLKDLINDYKQDETLKQWSTFQGFYNRNFNAKSNVFAFANIPYLSNAYAKKATGELKADLKKNIKFFQKLPFVAVDMVSKDNFYNTHFVLFSDDDLYKDELVDIKERNFSNEELQPVEFVVDTKTSLEEVQGNHDDPFEIMDLAILDLTAKHHFEYFEDSTIRIEVDVENGIKDGKYVEYYQNGGVKLKGKFDKDAQVGTWKFYNEEGSLVEKKKF